MKEFQQILEQCPLFDGIRHEDLTAMLTCIGGQKKTVTKGTVICTEGDPAIHVGMVLTGAVRMERADYYGNRSIVAYIGPAEDHYCHAAL